VLRQLKCINHHQLMDGCWPSDLQVNQCTQCLHIALDPAQASHVWVNRLHSSGVLPKRVKWTLKCHNARLEDHTIRSIIAALVLAGMWRHVQAVIVAAKSDCCVITPVWVKASRSLDDTLPCYCKSSLNQQSAP
jgi:hypothetical protein